MKKRTVYRDSKTGRFVKKATWKRSQSGRYKRQKFNVGAPTKRLPTPQPPPKLPDITKLDELEREIEEAEDLIEVELEGAVDSR